MTLPRESLYKYNRGLYRYDINPTIVTGNFTIGAGANFFETQIGQGAIIERTGAGLYQLTMDDTDITDVLCATCCIEDRAGAHTDLIARCEDITIGPPTTIDIEAYTSVPGAADVLTANDLYCHYQIIYTRSWQGQPDTRPRGYYHHGSTPTLVTGLVEIGAVGAVGTIHGEGIAGVVRNGAGDYTVTFTDAFTSFYSGGASSGETSGTGTTQQVCAFGPFTAGAAGAATLQIFTNDGAGAADPANGSYLSFYAILYGEESGA